MFLSGIKDVTKAATRIICLTAHKCRLNGKDSLIGRFYCCEHFYNTYLDRELAPATRRRLVLFIPKRGYLHSIIVPTRLEPTIKFHLCKAKLKVVLIRRGLQLDVDLLAQIPREPLRAEFGGATYLIQKLELF